MLKLFNFSAVSGTKHARMVHTSFVNCLDQYWRREKRLAENPNAEGPLTNLPDFTYMDGRPTPLGRRQKRRVMFQREIAQKIVTGSWEIDYAIDRHKRIEDQAMKEKEAIINNKLKPKGHLLLKKKQ